MYKDKFVCYIFGIDDLLLGGLVSGGSTLLGGLFQNNSNANIAAQANATAVQNMRETNAFNSVEASKARDFNAEQSQVNRDYLTEMSNTAHQRQVADLKAAGLNPILSAGGNGASVPNPGAASGPAASGSTAQTFQQSPVSNLLGNSVSSALGAAKSIQELKNLSETNAQIKSQTDLNRAQATSTLFQNAKTDQETKNLAVTRDKIHQDINIGRADEQKSLQATELFQNEWAKRVGNVGDLVRRSGAKDLVDTISSAIRIRPHHY